jgi:hypothetical protein
MRTKLRCILTCRRSPPQTPSVSWHSLSSACSTFWSASRAKSFRHGAAELRDSQDGALEHAVVWVARKHTSSVLSIYTAFTARITGPVFISCLLSVLKVVSTPLVGRRYSTEEPTSASKHAAGGTPESEWPSARNEMSSSHSEEIRDCNKQE